MPIDFYYFPLSPPCRSVLLLAKAIGVHLNLKTVNVPKGEHMKSEFLKINPQHTIPTIDDNGFVLCESRTIMAYLVSRYAKNDSLYPRDPKKRGIVDERLYFDVERLYDRTANCFFPVFLGKVHAVDEKSMKNLERSCEDLDNFLDGTEYVAGDQLTIADFSIATTVCLLETFNFDIGRYENVTAWYSRCKSAMEKFAYEDVHGPHVKTLKQTYLANLQECN